MKSRLVGLRLPDDLLEIADEFAKASGWSRCETIIYALEEFCPLPSGYVSRISGEKKPKVQKAMASGAMEPEPAAVAPVVQESKPAVVVVESKPKPAARPKQPAKILGAVNECSHGYPSKRMCNFHGGGCAAW